jgi:hypothetical protein
LTSISEKPTVSTTTTTTTTTTTIIIIIIIIIIISRRRRENCILVDVVIPLDRNVTQKEAENKLKYKGLCIEIQ